jgi:hypothetical protein
MTPVLAWIEPPGVSIPTGAIHFIYLSPDDATLGWVASRRVV